jgi:hypothetical protein
LGREVPNAGTPRLAYTYLMAVDCLRGTIEEMPDARFVAKKLIGSLYDHGLASTDTYKMLYKMHEHEQAGMYPADALERSLRND